MTDSAIRVTYLVQASAAGIDRRAEALLLEQTVELPRAVVRDGWVLKHIVGRVEDVRPEARGTFRVTVTHPLATAGTDPAQLLNVLFGNSSLQPDVVLADVELPPDAFQWLPGPRAGIAGLREAAGVFDRPLLATVLKPMGLSPERLAALCGTFARAGIDLIKDDHGLADHAFCPFEARVEACLRATAGTPALYVPNLSGTPEQVGRQLAFARRAGARAVLLSPMIVGLPLLHQLTAAPEGVPILAHPALGGVLRASEVLLYGKIFRWYGADAVIFPHTGGRFSYSEETCHGLASALRAPLPTVRPAFPMPAGGIRLDRVPELLEFYGPDCVLLLGSSLYEGGDQIFERAREVAERVARASAEPVR